MQQTNKACNLGKDGLQQKLYKPSAHSSLNDFLNLLISAIRQILQGPAGICQNLLITEVNEACKGWQSLLCLQTSKFA